MNDLISRHDAIEAVERHYRVDNDLLEVIAYGIRHLPSAQQWTPCKEGLPDPQNDGDKDFSDWVLISLYLHKGNSITTTAYYCFSEEKWYTKGRFVVGEITAWMPLPEPYKGEEI